MKTSFLSRLTSAVLFLLAVNAFAANAQSSKNISVNSFDGITISNGMDLYLTYGNSEGVKVVANKDLISNVLVEKTGTMLTISYKNNVRWGNMFKGQSIKVYVNVKTLHTLKASGGSDVYGENTIIAPNLELALSGGSDLKLTVQSNNLNVQSSGGSDLSLKGNATNVVIKVSGGSDVDAFGLKTEYAKVTASGGSDANVYVTKGLEAAATSGSDIQYKGNASVNITSSSKSGDVTKVN